MPALQDIHDFARFKQIQRAGDKRFSSDHSLKSFIKYIRSGKPKLYRKGGKVYKTGPAIVHKGEFVLPKGVMPTPMQIKKVNKLKK
tara:strand:- start:156 stop:413 length:258 start_codon:yes stop_codon:yes gene_type:complete